MLGLSLKGDLILVGPNLVDQAIRIRQLKILDWSGSSLTPEGLEHLYMGLAYFTNPSAPRPDRM